MLPFAFESGMGYERYVDYALDVPMYFVYRAGRYIDVAGSSFRDFLAGRLHGLPGERPTVDDWSDHLTTLFPEVRLKRFLEMRGADGGRWNSITALPAFWTGLLYDPATLDAAWDLVKHWSEAEREQLRNDVPKSGLAASFRGTHVKDLARDVVRLSRQGLKNRRRTNANSQDETIYVAPLEVIAGQGQTVSDDLLARYNGPWKRNIDRIFDEFAF